MDLSPISHEPMRPPAPLRLLVGSIAFAFILNLLPWSGALLRAHPDFVLLVLLYWSVSQPRSIGPATPINLVTAASIPEQVDTKATVQNICASATIDGIIAVAGIDVIDARPAQNNVVSRSSICSRTRRIGYCHRMGALGTKADCQTSRV